MIKSGLGLGKHDLIIDMNGQPQHLYYPDEFKDGNGYGKLMKIN